MIWFVINFSKWIQSKSAVLTENRKQRIETKKMWIIENYEHVEDEEEKYAFQLPSVGLKRKAYEYVVCIHLFCNLTK